MEMAEAEGVQEMSTSDMLAFELSAALRAIAGLLQLDTAGPTAAAMVAAVQQRVAELLAQLPSGFFEPLLPPGSLNDAQVCMCALVLLERRGGLLDGELLLLLPLRARRSM